MVAILILASVHWSGWKMTSAAGTEFYYIDASYDAVTNSVKTERRLCENPISLEDNATYLDGTSGEAWYMVSKDIASTERVQVSGDVKLILQDGMNWCATQGIDIADNGSLTIYGQEKQTGTILAQSGEESSVSVIECNDKSSLVINGGTYDLTTGYKSKGAGIGSGFASSKIEINGGMVDVETGYKSFGAGIGSRMFCSAGKIAIHGGKVKVMQGAESSGAGIGAGEVGDEGNIWITGGDIEIRAKTRTSGSGIGLASARTTSVRGSITIEGGNIFVMTGVDTSYGAGIGATGSGFKTEDDIRISGGNIKVVVNGNGLGINPGGRKKYDFEYGTLNISGGTVEIIKSQSATGRIIGTDEEILDDPDSINTTGMEVVKAGYDASSASETMYHEYTMRKEALNQNYLLMRKCDHDRVSSLEGNTMQWGRCILCDDASVGKCQVEIVPNNPHITYGEQAELQAVVKTVSGDVITDGVEINWIQEASEKILGTGNCYKIEEIQPAGKYAYLAEIHYQGAKVQKHLVVTIDKKVPCADDFAYEEEPNAIYDKTAPKVKVTVKEGITGMGEYSVLYKRDGEIVENPVDVGEYEVYVRVKEGDNYTAAKEDLKIGMYTCGKAIPEIGTVSVEGTVYDSTSPKKVTLTRTNETIPGELTLTADSFEQASEGDYEYVFTPKDQNNYRIVTGTVRIKVEKDYVMSIHTNGAPEKTDYIYGEEFSCNGLQVIAEYASGLKRDVTKQVIAGKLKAGDTKVLLSYHTEDGTKSCLYTGITVSKAEIPNLVPEDIETENDIKIAEEAFIKCYGEDSLWKLQEADRKKHLSAGDFLSVLVIYQGTDADNYKVKTKEIQIYRKPCVEDKTIRYSGEGEYAPKRDQAGKGHTECQLCGDILHDNIYVAASEHNYAKVRYVWSEDKFQCTAIRSCQVVGCGAEEKETVYSRYAVTVEPSCEKAGKGTYTATFKNSEFLEQVVETVVPAKGHQEATSAWSSDAFYHWRECQNVCQYRLQESPHQFVWVTDYAPTENAEGRKHEECSVCGFQKAGVVIEKLPMVKQEETTQAEVETTQTEITEEDDNELGEQKKKKSDSGKNKKKQDEKKAGKDSVGISKLDDRYKIIDNRSSKKDLEYRSSKDNKKEKIVVPDQIKEKGKTYNVTAIGNGAFSKKHYKHIILGKKITTIGSKAFYKCKNLKSITIRSTGIKKSQIAKNAFAGIGKEVIIYVPKEKLKSYKKMFYAKGLNKKVKIDAYQEK